MLTDVQTPLLGTPLVPLKASSRGGPGMSSSGLRTADLRTKILDFTGFDSSRILIVRNFPEILSQAILAGIILVGRLCVAGLRGGEGAWRHLQHRGRAGGTGRVLGHHCAKEPTWACGPSS